MGVGDDQLHPAQTATRQRAQEARPERLGLRGPDAHAQDFALPLGVHRDGDYHRHRDDPPGLPDLHVGRIDPQVGPVTLDRAVQEGAHPLVDLGAQPRDLALRDPAHAHRLHQLVDRARRHALHVGFLNHRSQRLLGGPARLEEAREVAPLTKLRDRSGWWVAPQPYRRTTVTPFGSGPSGSAADSQYEPARTPERRDQATHRRRGHLPE